ncbi:MAG: translation initiation factor IF-2 [Candidatus Aenigmarchaeota archaeon]|nr:translation initiation factor IF-2 [Candidatus Aenigmarchaeota archaeon]
MSIRQPIVAVLGHVDHGKTTLLDAVRGTAVASHEPGAITQSIGATNIPAQTIQKICGELLQKFKIELTIPGLLVIDSPGHASFVMLRKRGGAIADLAILVVDINEGFKEQTEESLNILKEYKTPFVVAATKIDKIRGWYQNKGSGFLNSLEKQREDVKEELNNRIYNLIVQMSERGFDSERFDRVEDFTKNIAIIPVSGQTGEGLPELLLMLSGLAQRFLKGKLELSEIGKGTVLEVKEIRGLGNVIDVILYDGSIERGNFVVVGGREPISTKIRSLLKPRELQELRAEKQFENIEKDVAATGIRISAPNLENVISGSPIVVVKSESDLENAKSLVQKEIENIQFERNIDGIVIKASTLGGLEALIKLLGEENVPIKKAEVGKITRDDIIEAQTVQDELKRVILTFDVQTPDEIKYIARDLGVMIFENDVIYRLIEGYKGWSSQKKEKESEAKLSIVDRPVEVQILKGAVFRVSDPAVFGVEVSRGYLKSGVLLKRQDGKLVGKVKEIQSEGKTVSEAKRGDRVAVSVENVTIGRQISEGDKLFSALGENDLKVLREVYDKLTDTEKELLDESS